MPGERWEPPYHPDYPPRPKHMAEQPEEQKKRKVPKPVSTLGQKAKGQFDARRLPGKVANAIISNPGLLASLAAAVGSLAIGGAALSMASDVRGDVRRLTEQVDAVEGASGVVSDTAETLRDDLDGLALAVDDLGAAVQAGDQAATDEAAMRAQETARDVAATAAQLSEQAKVLDQVASTQGAVTASVGEVRAELAGVASTLAGTGDALDALGADVAQIAVELSEAEAVVGGVSQALNQLDQELTATKDALASTQSTIQALDDRLAGNEQATQAAQDTADEALALAQSIATDQPVTVFPGGANTQQGASGDTATKEMTLPAGPAALWEFSGTPNHSACTSMQLLINGNVRRTVTFQAGDPGRLVGYGEAGTLGLPGSTIQVAVRVNGVVGQSCILTQTRVTVYPQ